MGAVLAVDLGTTRIKAAAFAEDGSLVAEADRTRNVLLGEGETAEQDPESGWELQVAVVAEVMAKSNVPIEAIVLTHQRGTFAPCEKGGAPRGNYVVWMDRRGLEECKRLERLVGDAYYDRLLQPIQPYGGISKMAWFERHHQSAPRYLPAQAVHAVRMASVEPFCDPSTASFLAPWRLEDECWDEEICKIVAVPTERLPAVISSTSIVGAVTPEAAAEMRLRPGTPLVLGGADGQCAAIGANVIKPGVVMVNVGTSTGVQAYCSTPLRHPARALNTAAHALPGAFEMEGHTQSSGATLDWLLRLLGTNEPGALAAQAAEVPAGADGVRFVPTFNGISAPVAAPEATGAILGLRLSHHRGHIARALFEGLALEVRWIMESLAQAVPPIERVVLAGGLSRSEWWAQLLADVLSLPITRVETTDAALTGAACLAREALGQEWRSTLRERDTFQPSGADASTYNVVYEDFVSALSSATTRGNWSTQAAALVSL